MAARRERGRGDDDGGPKPCEGVVKEYGCLGILQAGHDERRRCKSARRQGSAQRVNRRGIGCEQQRAIEDDWHDRLRGIERRSKPIEIDWAFARQIAGETRHRSGLARRKLEGGMACQPTQQCAHILAAAFAEITQQHNEFDWRERRSGGETDVIAILARQHGKHDAAFTRQRRQPLDPVFPPIKPAEQPYHDHLGARSDAVDPKIDRHRVTQVAQMREPHARQFGTLRVPRGGKTGQIAVGER